MALPESRHAFARLIGRPKNRGDQPRFLGDDALRDDALVLERDQLLNKARTLAL